MPPTTGQLLLSVCDIPDLRPGDVVPDQHIQATVRQPRRKSVFFCGLTECKLVR